MSDPSISVHDEPSLSRFEITEGERVLGFVAYRDGKGQRTFTHTEIDPNEQGRGLGGKLVRAALDDARARGQSVRPVCPFVRSYIAFHPEYLDLVRQQDRERFRLPGEPSRRP